MGAWEKGRLLVLRQRKVGLAASCSLKIPSKDS